MHVITYRTFSHILSFKSTDHADILKISIYKDSNFMTAYRVWRKISGGFVIGIHNGKVDTDGYRSSWIRWKRRRWYFHSLGIGFRARRKCWMLSCVYFEQNRVLRKKTHPVQEKIRKLISKKPTLEFVDGSGQNLCVTEPVHATVEYASSSLMDPISCKVRVIGKKSNAQWPFLCCPIVVMWRNPSTGWGRSGGIKGNGLPW